MSLNAEINLRTVIDTFAPEDDIRHALFLTYTFDGGILEDVDRGLLDLLWRRNCENVLVVRDGKAILAEKRSHRYSVINAAYSRRTFHPKLMLLLTSSEVLAAIGSANLTRGGLENNLELVGVYRLTRNSGPLSLFRSLRDYLGKSHLRLELAATSSQQRKAFDVLQRDLDRFLNEASAVRSPIEPLFLHNYDEALLPQIIKALPNQKLETMWVVSPFFEPDPIRNESLDKRPQPDTVPLSTKGDDPPDDRLDETLLKEVFKQLNFIQNDQPPVRIYFQASTTNVTRLPLNALQQFKSQIALFGKTSTIDSRNLHAKMLVFAGHDQSGQPFVTIVHGSANFTRCLVIHSTQR